MKKLFRTVLPILLILTGIMICLAGCGKKSVRRLNSDGSVSMIEYRNPLPFQRAPYFEAAEGIVSMSFNNIVWYTAEIITDKDCQAFGTQVPVAESSNLTVYQAEEDEQFPYRYILKLTGTETSFVCFRSTQEPGDWSYGNDFSNRISYFVGGIETVPDVEGLK